LPVVRWPAVPALVWVWAIVLLLPEGQ